MRIASRFRAFMLVFSAILVGWSFRPSGGHDGIAIRPNVLVTGTATPQQLELARWAVERFEIAGLEPPSVEIRFHADPSGCAGHLGFARRSQVDVCTTLLNAMTRRALLHEMSHVWLDQNVSLSTRTRFLEIRGLVSWNSYEDPWRVRGYEQAAEILSWAIGEPILSAQIPDNSPARLTAAFELLTRGLPLPYPGNV
jgi:hypothetical protein